MIATNGADNRAMAQVKAIEQSASQGCIQRLRERVRIFQGTCEFSTQGRIVTVAPSAQEPGRFQATIWEQEQGATSHFVTDTINEAISQLKNLGYEQEISQQAADEYFAQNDTVEATAQANEDRLKSERLAALPDELAPRISIKGAIRRDFRGNLIPEQAHGCTPENREGRRHV